VSGLLDGTIPSRPPQSALAEVIALLVIALVTALLLPRLAPLAGFGLFLGLVAGVALVAILRAAGFG